MQLSPTYKLAGVTNLLFHGDYMLYYKHLIESDIHLVSKVYMISQTLQSIFYTYIFINSGISSIHLYIKIGLVQCHSHRNHHPCSRFNIFCAF